MLRLGGRWREDISQSLTDRVVTELFRRPAVWTGMTKRLAIVLLGLTLLLSGCGRKPGPSASPSARRAAPVDGRAKVRAELAAHRAQEIARLRDYARAGAFPVNTTQRPTGHFFKDVAGRYCAVANLVHQDGRDDLVDEVVRANNALVVADVHTGGLHDWILASGLTQEELARIQLPAPMVRMPIVPTAPVAANPTTTAAPHLPSQPGAAPVPTEEEMREMVRAHLAAVEAELLRDTKESLNLAADRLVQAHPLAAT